MTTGWIYEIRNTVTGRVYIGSTLAYKARFQQHRRHLYNHKHCNKLLQEDWDTYGRFAFDMTILEEVPDPDNDRHFGSRLRQVEGRYVAQAEKAGEVYNIHPVVRGLGDWQKRAGYDVSHRGLYGPGRPGRVDE